MTLKIEIVNLASAKSRLRGAASKISGGVFDGQEEVAEDIFDEVKRTSPVRSGTYKSNWDMIEDESKNVIFLHNDTKYAKYLVYPNTRMVGSPRADDPTRGIIHNVRGIVQKHKSGYSDKVSDKVSSIMDSL
jgi:hypothetical protein